MSTAGNLTTLDRDICYLGNPGLLELHWSGLHIDQHNAEVLGFSTLDMYGGLAFARVSGLSGLGPLAGSAGYLQHYHRLSCDLAHHQ